MLLSKASLSAACHLLSYRRRQDPSGRYLHPICCPRNWSSHVALPFWMLPTICQLVMSRVLPAGPDSQHDLLSPDDDVEELLRIAAGGYDGSPSALEPAILGTGAEQDPRQLHRIEDDQVLHLFSRNSPESFYQRREEYWRAASLRNPYPSATPEYGWPGAPGSHVASSDVSTDPESQADDEGSPYSSGASPPRDSVSPPLNPSWPTFHSGASLTVKPRL